MRSISMVLAAIFLPTLAFAGYYWSGKERIELNPVAGEYSFHSNAVKNAMETKILKKAFFSDGTVYFFSKLSEKERSQLAASGTLLPAQSRGEGWAPVYLHGTLFVKLYKPMKEPEIKKLFAAQGLTYIRSFDLLPQWHLVAPSQEPIETARLLVEKGVAAAAEPSFYLPVSFKAYTPNDFFFPNQWHLRNEGGTSVGLQGNDHSHVAEAWELIMRTGGVPGKNARLSIIDDGFDLMHEDIAGRFEAQKDFGTNANMNMYSSQTDAHGTCCAGVAAGKWQNNVGIAGACPECTLIPVRINLSNAYSLDQIAIDSFTYAQSVGADIASCSWGPADGGGAVDMGQPLKDLVQTMTTTGRNGKGIIILFAAGNGNESIETDGFAKNQNVFAIGAVNAAGKRASYSDYGPSLDFVSSSCDQTGDGWGSGSTKDGIWTTDNQQGGYNPGQMTGDQAGIYAGQFGGTSSAAPLAAGIIGLILAVNPELTRDELYDVLKKTADKVAMGAMNPNETPYDQNGFSPHYGWGRINACEAVKEALIRKGVTIPDNPCNSEAHTVIEVPDDVKPDIGQPDTDSETADALDQDEVPTADSAPGKDDGGVIVREDEGCGCTLVQ